MKKSGELREAKALLIEQMDKIHATAEKEDRTLNEAEESKYNDLKKQVVEMDKRIALAVEHEERQLAIMHDKATTISAKEKRELKSYSVMKAIRSMTFHKPLDGIEREMHEEAEREARTGGFSISGVGIPSMMVKTEKRADQPLQDTATYGVDLIPTNKTGFIDFLKPDLVAESLGATMMRGLQGDVSIPKALTGLTASWEGEIDVAAETQSTFGSVALTPHRLAAFTDISKQLINQSSIDVEAWVRNEISRTTAQKLESTIISGDTGGSDPFMGVLNYTGVGDVTVGATGGAPTYALMAQMESEVAIDNALIGKLAWMINHKLRSKLRTVAKDSGSGQFIWEPGNTILGYNVGVTSLVPSNLAKSTSGNVLSAAIFGNWEDMMIGQWGGYDITVDPYTLSTYALVRVVINSFWDMKLKHAESFAICDEFATT